MVSARRRLSSARLAVFAQSSILAAGLLAGVAPAPAAAATNYGLVLNGTSQYVTFGGTTALGASQFTLETWFNRTGAGSPTSTGSKCTGIQRCGELSVSR